MRSGRLSVTNAGRTIPQRRPGCQFDRGSQLYVYAEQASPCPIHPYDRDYPLIPDALRASFGPLVRREVDDLRFILLRVFLVTRILQEELSPAGPRAAELRHAHLPANA